VPVALLLSSQRLNVVLPVGVGLVNASKPLNPTYLPPNVSVATILPYCAILT
jgi:hypothetical protein